MAKRSFSRLVKIAAGASGEKELLRAGEQVGKLEHFAHFWGFVGTSFVQNRCLVRASALSYTTLLALIPLLAIIISITSGILKKQGEQDIYKAIDKFISQVMPPADVPVTEEPSPASTTKGANALVTPAAAANARVTVQNVAAERIHEFIRNTRSGALGLTGSILLIFVAISMLNSVESAFNDIWGVARGRNLLMRLLRFWTAISLGPLLIAVAIGLAGGSHFQATSALVQKTPIIGRLLFEVATVVFIWLVFAVLYQFIPNTRVHFSAALAGGITAGTLWHLNNLFGFLYVSRVVSNSKIYGGLGLVPVFMAGLYLSWAILLLGAQTAYAFQNRKIYLQEKMIEDITWRDREILALRLMTSIGRRFQAGSPPATVEDIGAELAIPTRLVQQVLKTLLNSKIVAEAAGKAYAPGRPLESITAHDILQALRSGAGQDLVLPNTCVSAEVLSEFEKIEQAERSAASPITLLALIQRSQPQNEPLPLNRSAAS